VLAWNLVTDLLADGVQDLALRERLLLVVVAGLAMIRGLV
jgi:hypothetical protein